MGLVTTKEKKGDATRAAILDRAVDLASVEGLEGLTIGRLASELEMSKSGLFAHFGSKQELQLATVEAAATRFRRAVIEPAAAAAEGAPRPSAPAGASLAAPTATGGPAGGVFSGPPPRPSPPPARARSATRSRPPSTPGSACSSA